MPNIVFRTATALALAALFVKPAWGQIDANAMVWASVSPEPATYGVHRGVLIALDATNLGYLWSDADPKISIAKFVPPTVAGGKVFRASSATDTPIQLAIPKPMPPVCSRAALL